MVISIDRVQCTGQDSLAKTSLHVAVHYGVPRRGMIIARNEAARPFIATLLALQIHSLIAAWISIGYKFGSASHIGIKIHCAQNCFTVKFTQLLAFVISYCAFLNISNIIYYCHWCSIGQ